MSKQIQSAAGGRHSSGNIAANVHKKEVESEESRRTTSSAPEISIALAEGEEERKVEIDFRTGLPKLPVEPLPPSSPDTPRRLLSSALKTDMSSAASSSSKRKSVTFGPSTDTEDGPGSPKSMPKVISESSVIIRDPSKQSQRSNGRPTSLPSRSRSVLIRLQPPKGTPTLPIPHSLSKRVIGKSDSLPHGHGSSGVEEARQQCRPRMSEPYSETNTAEARVDADAAPGSDSPIFNRWSSQQQFGRRSSFLYSSESEVGDDPAGNSASYMGGEDFVTPFAQILSTLHRVRSEYLMLMGLPEATMTSYSRPTWTQAASPNPAYHQRLPDQKDPAREKLAMDVLEELDWSLKTLETVNAGQSMGNMTGAKFKRLLNRELSHLSENSEKGAQVAAWVTNITNPDPYDVDKALGTTMYTQSSSESTNNNYVSSLSASLSHDNWIRRKKLEDKGRRITIESESIPTYGIDVPNMDKEQMRQYMEWKLYEWEVDAFHFDKVSGGNPLISAAYLLFKRRNFFSEFQISPHVFINYMTAIQNSYHSGNRYHNAIHAADVLLTTNKLISADNLEGVFTSVEVMAALIAAAVHDVDHPGVTNQFLVAIRHDLAIMYNDISVLENHHVATAFRTLQSSKCNFLLNLDTECVQLFRKVVIDMVLSTDMGRHIQHVAEMKTLMETKKLTNEGLLSLDSYSESSAVLKCLIHCADLSNPMKPPEIAAEWSYRIMEENFKQGDREKELHIPVHAMGDRDVVAIPKCQISFIDFIVYPLWETWAELVYPHAQCALDNITTTKNYWCKLAKEGESGEDFHSILTNPDSSSSDTDDDIQIRDVNSLHSSSPHHAPAASKEEPKEEAVRSKRQTSSSSSSSSSIQTSSSVRGKTKTRMSSPLAQVKASGAGVHVIGQSQGQGQGQSQGSLEEELDLAGSADSATLRSAFQDSAASDRRTSFKVGKQNAVAHDF